MPINYKVATYNTASNSDYALIHEQKYSRDAKLGQVAFRALADMGIDFFCLQEATTYEKGDVFFEKSSWIKDDIHSSHTKRYDYIHNTKGIALVWNNEQFTIVDNSVRRKQDYLVADFYDKTNHKIIRLASIHISGYSFNDHLGKQKSEKEFQEDLADQHKTVSQLIQDLKSDNRADFTIIGSDTNSIPAIYPGLHQAFESSGYSYDKENFEPTNYFAFSASPNNSCYRRLDYIFNSWFLTAKQLDRPDIGSFKLKDTENPSDHIPVIYSMTQSFISRLLKVLCDFFTWRPSVEIEQYKSYKDETQGYSSILDPTMSFVDGHVSKTIKIKR
ncbi:MAG: endonuclease/exonuclease/phosphatase family protein [Chlamydiales bacterium]|nr:endonuclease/exonuclease/phosphatase family protein [Chlamydiales bacterium]